MSKKKSKNIFLSLITILVLIPIYYKDDIKSFLYESNYQESNVSIEDIPEFSDEPYITINNNIPSFSEEEITLANIEIYSPLDSLDRCTGAFAVVSIATMPTEDRTSISSVKPTGWHSIQYNGDYLYNRCHLIGFQLTGENANENNLITCTSYMNKGAMLDFENMVADYVRETNNHVLYRSTPIFNDNDLLAYGVQLEALSIEDDGAGIKFNIFLYNVQPNIYIDYLTGDSELIYNP